MGISIQKKQIQKEQILKLYTLENGKKMKVVLSNYGASVLGIYTPDKNNQLSNIVLQLPLATDYLATRSYIGATIGRVAGRISAGSMPLPNAKTIHLSKNEPPHHLHGGFTGLDNQFWKSHFYETAKEQTVVFSLFLADKSEGYPGNIFIQTSYTLTDENQLIIKYRAYSDKMTLFNPTNHMYFNLSGKKNQDILSHELYLSSSFYSPISSESIPLGQLKEVQGTLFDLNTPTTLRKLVESKEQTIDEQKGLNHPWLLENKKYPIMLKDSKSGRRIRIQTDQEAVIIYTGNHFQEAGSSYNQTGIKKYGGIAIECQALPDAGKYPGFGSNVLPGNTFYESKTIYVFDVYNERKEEKK